MARVPLESFSDREICRVFIAGSVAEADRVEVLLTREGIDYAIALEPYHTIVSLMFVSKETSGAAFYVLSGQEQYCRSALTTQGLGHGLVDADD